MDKSLHTIPNFYVNDPSPKVQDSAFPPFKMEHRYRGVYERAGFDVNLRGFDSPKDDTRSIFSNTTRDSRRQMRRYPTPPKSSTESLRSPTFSPKYSNIEPPKTAIGYEGSQKTFSENLRSGYPKSAHQLKSFSQSVENVPAGRNDGSAYNQRNYSESFLSNASKHNQLDSASSIDSKPNSRVPYGMNKNHKNLQLNLKNGSGDFSRDTESEADSFINRSGDPNDTEDTSTSLEKLTSPVSAEHRSIDDVPVTLITPPEENISQRQFDPRGRLGSTSSKNNQRYAPEISTRAANQKVSPTNPKFNPSHQPPNDSRQMINNGSHSSNDGHHPQFTHTNRDSDVPPSVLVHKNEIINSALDDFRRDVQKHKVYSPNTHKMNESRPEKPQLPSASPSELGLGRSRFDEYPEGTSNQNLLSARMREENRFSQLSMVSSIISRDSGCEDEEDEVVEEELERQLELLKAGGSGSSLNVDKDQRSFDFGDRKNNTAQNIPTFKIEETDFSSKANSTRNKDASYQFKDRSEESDSFSENEYEEMSSGAVYEAVRPLSVRNSAVISNNENASEKFSLQKTRSVKFKNTLVRDSDSVKSVQFNDTTKQFDSPTHSFKSAFDEESVKPLSPKTHMVEEELRNINFKVDPETPNNLKSPLSRQNAYDSIDDDDDDDDDDDESDPSMKKYAPGQGPCRGCNRVILPMAKGSSKAIFSKDGELSGQWHRSCFTCGDPSCDIVFNKKVQCYVLDDTPYCNVHYHELNDTVCHKCSNGIEGECIENELEQKWHLSCLACTKCAKPIKSDYYLINDLIYCENDMENIMNGNGSFNDAEGNLRTGGLSTNDKIEKRRTRLLYLD